MLPTLRADTVSRLCSEENGVHERRCRTVPTAGVYAVVRDENGQAAGIVARGCICAPTIGRCCACCCPICSSRCLRSASAVCSACGFLSRSREPFGYEPDAFRHLFLQRMDILDALDEGLMAIDEHSMITYI